MGDRKRKAATAAAEMHNSYLLESTARTTYVGYSPDPHRRLRQHNGELAGGERATQRHRPWQLLLYVSGFRNQVRALQFESTWQRPEVRTIRPLPRAHALPMPAF